MADNKQTAQHIQLNSPKHANKAVNSSAKSQAKESEPSGKLHRTVGLDVIRTLAIFLVIFGHFFVLNTDFTHLIVNNVSMFVQALLMNIAFTGVPLFLMLTGYLNANKRWSKKYFKSLIRVLASYLFFAVITIAFRKYWMHQDEVSWYQWFMNIMNFTAVPYGWYIEMWIGLFLMTPFLNILWKALPDKRNKLGLIAVLIVMSAFPSFLNYHTLELMPNWWENIFPVMFYYIGTYIREYMLKIKSLWIIISVIIVASINPVINITLFHGQEYQWFTLSNHSLTCTIIATLLFVGLYRVNVHVGIIRTIFTRVSMVSLDMYLVCYIFDQLVYPYFKSLLGTDQATLFIWSPAIVGSVFILSYMAAELKNILFRLIRIPT